MSGSAVVLMYHNIGAPPRGTGLKSLYVTPRMFRFQMRYLKTAGFRVVPLPEILSVAAGERPRGKLVALTFDDGYQDFHDNAHPVLRAHNYPATVFVVTGMAGAENSWDSGPPKRLMEWDTIRKLQRQGVAFGSHTLTHPFLTRLTPGKREEEIRNSRAVLQDRLQQTVESFCYPYGDYDPEVRACVQRAGYRLAVTVRRGLVHNGDDPFELRRSFIRLNTHPLLFACKLHTRYEDVKGGR